MQAFYYSIVVLAASIAVYSHKASAEDKVYWVDTEGSIYAHDLETGRVHVVVDAAQTGNAATFFEAVDSLHQIFVTFTDASLIKRLDQDGSVVGPDISVPGVRRIDVIPESLEIFYTTITGSEYDQIRALSFNGKNDHLVLSAGASLVPLEPEFERASQAVYFTAGSVDVLKIGAILWSLESDALVAALGDVQSSLGWSLEVDPRRQKVIYGYTEGDPPLAAGARVERIERANADFTGREIIWDSGNEIFDALALDERERKLYFAELDSVSGEAVFMRTDLDGSDAEELFRTTSFPVALDILVDRPKVCTFDDTVDDQWDRLVIDAGLDEDFDRDGLPQSVSLEMMQRISCAYEEYATELGAATDSAFNLNLETFDFESVSDSFTDFREGVSALMLIGADTDAALRAFFANGPGEMLTGTYHTVTCSGRFVDCRPVSSFAARAVDDVYSGSGDPDRDGKTNAEEWAEVVANGGTLDDFIEAVFGDLISGTRDSADDTGTSSCFIATAAYGTPLAGDLKELRAIRDQRLLPYAVGSAIVDIYYRVSPPVARLVASSEPLRIAVRVLLSLMLRPSLYAAVIGLVGLASLIVLRRLAIKHRIPARNGR